MNIIKEIKLIYSGKGGENVKVTCSDSAYQIFIENWDLATIELQEEFKVLLLNRSNVVLGIYNMSRGGVSGTVVDIKLLLASAIKANASNIIIAHNHPSGNLKPSDCDVRLTKKIKEASGFLDISLLDHLIVTKEGFYSFLDERNLQ